MRRILVIDDDPLFRDPLVFTLRRAGYAVTAPERCRDIEALLAAERFFAVITELHMPETDGIAMMLRVRRLSPPARLIGMSVGGAGIDALWFRAMKALGAVDVLEKPIDCGALLALLDPPPAEA